MADETTTSPPLSYSYSSSSVSSMNKVGLGYGVAIAVGMMVFVCTMMLVCVRLHAGRGGSSRRSTTRNNSTNTTTINVVLHTTPRDEPPPGLDEETIETYPKFMYSAKEPIPSPLKDTSCSICLADYDDGEPLRLLPDCNHVFHAQCIDAWLRLHVSCPVCRSSPLPSPIPTPLSELIPLARNPLR